MEVKVLGRDSIKRLIAGLIAFAIVITGVCFCPSESVADDSMLLSLEDGTPVVPGTNVVPGTPVEPKDENPYYPIYYYPSYTPPVEEPSVEEPSVGDIIDTGDETVIITLNDTGASFKPVKNLDVTVRIPSVVYDKEGKKIKITAVDKAAFKNDEILKRVVLGNNITTIGASAFNGCSALDAVVIGKNVSKIGANAFKGASSLRVIRISSTKIKAKNISAKAFKGVPANTVIKVPKSKLKSYTKIFREAGLSKKVVIKAI